MFIYIGNELVVESNRVIAILDYELTESSRRLNEVIDKHVQLEKVYGSETDAKAIIITMDAIYYSPFSTITLKNRDEIYETF